ncbi:hypothetical protein GLOIN_2v1781474 [Rhizophagus clarus]|uniref:Bromo domain-containing protein n=1 Tax=Rhizophagus clarus TaxID=94130 RepID=A0A8H3LSZ3_9GLOM|nr:hypothetical protein GLOIN_2v1781474 [Rhizophagus clarus]
MENQKYNLYLNKQPSFYGFLISHRDIIFDSITTTNLKELDSLWYSRFLLVVENFPDLKTKVRFFILQKYKENLVPTITDKIPTTKDSSNADINLIINFCYNILHELENKSNINLFYKLTEKTNKFIKNPMDIFTISSKLDNDKYTNIEEFEKDMHLIFHNCYTYNNTDSKIYQKKELMKMQDNDINSTLAYKNLVAGNIILFIKNLKTSLLSRSQMSLFSMNEHVLQAIIEGLLPQKYRIPELSLVMNGKKQKGSGLFGYLDIFVVKGVGDYNISLELKYVSLVGLIKKQKDEYGANDLEDLDKTLEKENEKLLLNRPYLFWSKEHNKMKQITISETLEKGINQLRSYMNVIADGKPADYFSSGIFDKRVKITKSNPNELKGFVILVIGFRRILWRPVEEVMTNYSYNKV